MGAVLHTLNIRLFPEQLRYIVEHAEDAMLFLDPSLREVWEASGAKVDRVIELGDEYEQLLAEQPADRFEYPELDDRSGRGPLLHERHDRQPEGRPVLAPLEHPARDGQVPRRQRRRSSTATS